MFQLTTLSQQNRDFIVGLVNSGRSRDVIVAICLAKAIADSLPMTEAVNDDINNHYNRTLAITVLQMLSQINEQVVVNVDAVSTLTKNFYVYRYHVAFAPAPVLVSPTTGCLDFFGITKAMSVADIDVIQNNPMLAMKYYNGFLSLVRELISASAKG